MRGTIGIDAKLPLFEDRIDLFYGLTKTLKENTKQKIKMLLLTAPGERIMVPDYGVGLRDFLFENTPEFEIQEKIIDQVSRFLPEIEITNLEINRSSSKDVAKKGQKNSLSVRFEYFIKGTREIETVDIVSNIAI